MNYIEHLNQFFKVSRRDNRLSTSHFSMYMALFYIWNGARFKSPFPIIRDELMSLSHIGSKTTYLKVLSDLHQFGYIKFEKSKFKHLKSRVSIGLLVQKGSEAQLSLFTANVDNQANNEPSHVKNEPTQSSESGHSMNQNWSEQWSKTNLANGPKMGSFINNNKQGKREKNEPPAHELPGKKLFLNTENGVWPPPKKNDTTPQNKPVVKELPDKPVPPTLKQVHHFFSRCREENNLQFEVHKESEKFYAHYSAIGWKLGGITPILNWQAAARKWLYNLRPEQPLAKKQSLNAAAPQMITPPNRTDYSIPL